MSISYKYKVSLIIPIYNMEKFLRDCLNSVVKQTIDPSQMEVLLVSDGSKDSSIDIMKEYAAKYPYMKIFEKENEGLSMTRNYAIARAQGKYLMYLDADDTLSPNTLKLVTDFFDDHYDEIDLVTYDEIPIINGEEGALHYRYEYFDGPGVYDLNKFEYVFASQTRINVAVKNVGDDNILFDFDRTFRQEDQKYCTQVLQRKMKIGYCPNATYYYLHQPESIVRTYFYAYYIFESSMRFWEEIFGYYGGDKIPPYIQALYVNDINWKTASDILLPYHYTPEKFEEAKDRVYTLLDKIDDKVILNHPALDKYQKHNLISLKRNNEIMVKYEDNYIFVENHGEAIINKGKFKIMINRFKIKDRKLSIIGVLESTVLDYIDKPVLVLHQKSMGKQTRTIELRQSSYSYHKAKAITANKYFFDIDISVEAEDWIRFAVLTGEREYECKCRFNKYAPFGQDITSIIRAGMKITYRKGRFSFRQLTEKQEKKAIAKVKRKCIRREPLFWLMRNNAYRLRNKKIWLYYDCKGVFKDNGYYQFIHDIEIDDGVERYYILNEEAFSKEIKKYPVEVRKRTIKFGSWKHKELFLGAEKIVTAFIERGNYNPFDAEYTSRNGDMFDIPDIYYLQHGVLHAHAPWKYSQDRNFAHKAIISTTFEDRNLKENYCFSDKHLAKTGMPRYDFIDTDVEKGKNILYAPSWRKYLITQAGSEWIATESKFVNSDFYKESLAFLNSDELKKLLEEHDTYLDFKLHPIFEVYKDLYTIDNPRVRLADKKITETDYSVFITDFSSFVFDFAYISTPVIYFMPDHELFRAGLNYYRELDMPMEDGLGPFTANKEALLNALEIMLEGDSEGKYTCYREKMGKLFFYKDNKQRDRIYKEIRED